jgi:hypothetical protein
MVTLPCCCPTTANNIPCGSVIHHTHPQRQWRQNERHHHCLTIQPNWEGRNHTHVIFQSQQHAVKHYFCQCPTTRNHSLLHPRPTLQKKMKIWVLGFHSTTTMMRITNPGSASNPGIARATRRVQATRIVLQTIRMTVEMPILTKSPPPLSRCPP